MKPSIASACNPAQIGAFLHGQMSVAEEQSFAAHLEGCAKCRAALEESAGDVHAWAEAAQMLSPCPSADAAADDAAAEDDTLASPQRPSQQVQAVLDSLTPTDDPQMLGRLGHYEISGVIGSGGMGIVLKAVDSSLDRTLAIKVLAPHLAGSGAARKRFSREARAAAAILHPNVIAIHGVCNDGPLPYLVMPYVPGLSLQKRLDRDGPLSVQEVLRIGAQVAAGLAAAHAQGLVHRDIKPANILLEQGVERVTITDFGLARTIDDAAITQSGVVAGTPQFMSPEQARGDAVDPRSDLFSLGSLLYTACTGRPPFRAQNVYGVMRRITDDAPPSMREANPDVPDWLCRIIARLMAKSPAERFESAAEVAALLERCLAHTQQPDAVRLPDWLLAPSPRRRRPFNLRSKGALAMSSLITSAVIVFALWQAGLPAGKPDAHNAKQPATAPATQPAEAAVPNFSSPKQAVKSFKAALLSGDPEAVKKCVLDQPGHREAAVAMTKLSAVAIRLEAACKKRFDTTLESSGNPHVTLNLPDPNAVNYATVKGDDHFAVVTLPGKEKDPIRVAKVGDQWRVDLTDAKTQTPEDLKKLAEQAEMMVKPMDDLAKQVAQGKFDSVVAVRWAFLSAMMEAGIAKVEVKVTPTGKTEEKK